MKNFSIMKKTYLFCLASLAFGLTACENYFDEKYMDNGDPQYTHNPTVIYTLTDADYKTVATNKANIALAESMDVEGDSTYQKALAQLSKTHYFDSLITPSQFLPAFLHNKYLQFDEGAVAKITYNYFDGTPEWLDLFNQTIRYELKAKDYKTVWGVDDKRYLTPANEAQVTNFLPMIEDNYLLGAKYSFAEYEGAPVRTKEVLYIYKDGVTWEIYSNDPVAYILQEETHGQVLNFLHNTYPYAIEGDSAIILQYNSKTKLYAATEYKHDGVEFVTIDGISEEHMSFGLSSEGWKELPIYYRQALAGDADQGEIVTQDFDMEEGITYIWTFDTKYGMKATSFVSGANHAGEGWCILPGITLKKAVKPALSFDQAVNYVGNLGDTVYTQLSVWVSTDYDPENPDVREATWTQLPWNKNEDGTYVFPEGVNWVYVNSGYMDLSQWNNETIYIGFRYLCAPNQKSTTWEIKNILVNEP